MSLRVAPTIDSLNKIYIQLNNYIEPLIIVLGTIGNIASIYIFTRPSLKSPCSLYFLASSINNFAILYFGIVTRMLADGYDIDPTSYSRFFCKFRNYFSYMIYLVSPLLIVLTTVDRFCASSTNSQRRKFSSIIISRWAIGCVAIFALLFFIHILIFFEIDINSHICQPKLGLYSDLLGLSTLAIYVIGLCLMMVFGALTINNVRNQRRRVKNTNTTNTQSQQERQVDKQLFIMLLLHIACFVILGLPYVIMLIFSGVLSAYKTTSIFIFIQNISRILLNLSSSIQFYIYTLGSRLYRQEFLKALNKLSTRLLGKNIINMKNAIAFNQSKITQT
ncbi:unnamed protein product [Didymodactylos carnosus]|uniref:G-protein coupled receptors family 1 profile domain-containing protein n=1 Tax=Didymodactylos carnosus TaxID=1234261 RepID=A0A814HFT4_9BILA|nr:unnamed protein product [Didymodactylos carnosus]CAF3781534.1 unnamed protein product [Didymodactylos carnosus]